MSARNQPRTVILSSAADWAADALAQVITPPPASLNDHMMMVLQPKVRLLSGPLQPLQQVINCAIPPHLSFGGARLCSWTVQPLQDFNLVWLCWETVMDWMFCLFKATEHHTAAEWVSLDESAMLHLKIKRLLFLLLRSPLFETHTLNLFLFRSCFLSGYLISINVLMSLVGQVPSKQTDLQPGAAHLFSFDFSPSSAR